MTFAIAIAVFIVLPLATHATLTVCYDCDNLTL
jgi:hypothetical protein